VRYVKLDEYYDTYRNRFRSEAAEANLKNELIKCSYDVLKFIEHIIPDRFVNFIEPEIIFDIKEHRPEVIKDGKNLWDIYVDLKNFLMQCVLVDGYHNFELHIIEILKEIESILRYCSVSEEEKIELDQESEIMLNDLLLDISLMIKTDAPLAKHLDLNLIMMIVKKLKDREVNKTLLGSYDYRNHTITLFLDSICKSRRAFDYGEGETHISTYAHELFHAYHYQVMRHYTTRWNTKRSYEQKVVAESLASYFEFLFVKFEINDKYFADSLSLSWKRHDMSYWPYAGALSMLQDELEVNTRFIPDDFIGKRAFNMIFNDSLDDWHLAFQDISTLIHINRSDYGIKIDVA